GIDGLITVVVIGVGRGLDIGGEGEMGVLVEKLVKGLLGLKREGEELVGRVKDDGRNMGLENQVRGGVGGFGGRDIGQRGVVVQNAVY
ncbi:hypothetical protein, partial [Neisseria sicca]|uniref:hypothetical protein n=1 Tax=Neisseria sicca TaxID=490 RepID=UPI001C9906E1